MATRSITTKPAHPGAKHHWRVYVDGRLAGWVQETTEGTFTGLKIGKVFGSFPSRVQAVDAVAEAVL